ncbi:MAG TPA: DUF4126 domain-containing protein, partial [Thermoanaerobaculia bacterium]
GLGLAAAAGFNAWAVLLVFSGLYRLLPQEFPGAFAAFLGGRTLFGFALVLFLLELVIKKIPLLDRFWELAHTLIRPIVGALLAVASVPGTSLPRQIGIGLAGAVATAAAHVAKSTTRLETTAATHGWTQFALSLAEDVVAVVLALLVFFVPWMTALFLGGLLIVIATHLDRVGRALGVLFFRLQHPRRRPPPKPAGA